MDYCKAGFWIVERKRRWSAAQLWGLLRAELEALGSVVQLCAVGRKCRARLQQ